MNQEKSCGCIVLNSENEVLLVHHNAGHWDFPKGHVENIETEEQTAVREVKEETNIDVKIENDYRYSVRYSPKENVTKEVIYFLARNINNNTCAQIDEVSEVKWFSITEAIEKITYDNTREILIQLINDLKKKGRV